MWDDDYYDTMAQTQVQARDARPAVMDATEGQVQVRRRPRPDHLPSPQPDVLDLLVRRAPRGDDTDGAPEAVPLNLQVILENDSRWVGRLVYDEWTAEPLVWDEAEGGWRVLRDTDYEAIRQWVSGAYGLHFQPRDVERCVKLACSKAVMREIPTWLDGLVWDQTPRLDVLWTAYFACEDHPLASVYGRKWMIQAVARALAPGCEAHAMVVLQGAQGKGKTRGVHALAGRTPRGVELSNDLPTDRAVSDRDSLMTLRAAWIVNVDELEALNRSSIAAVKSWITARKDVYRAPYATMPETHQRHCVLIGSTNMATFLHDSTGSRRFWAMTIASDRKVDVDGLAADRDQLWAEAVHRYRAGEQWWLTDEETEQQASLNTRYEDEGWREDDITEFLFESGGRCTIHQVIEFLHARRPIGGDEGKAAGRIRAALQRAGWKLASGKARVGKPYPVRYWYDPRVAGSGGL